MVKSRRRASCSAVPKDVVVADEEVVLLLALAGIGLQLELGGVGPEGGDLHDLPALEIHVRQPETASDEPAVPEDAPHLARHRAGRDVEVLGSPAREKVPDAPAHQVRLVPVLQQPVHHLQRIRVELVRVDLRRVVCRNRSGGIEVVGIALPEHRRDRLGLLLVVGWRGFGHRAGKRIRPVLVVLELLVLLRSQLQRLALDGASSSGSPESSAVVSSVRAAEVGGWGAVGWSVISD
jgi:hypothetical protein